MKDWKTTLAGALGAAAAIIPQIVILLKSGTVSVTNILLGISAGLIGYHASDKKDDTPQSK